MSDVCTRNARPNWWSWGEHKQRSCIDLYVEKDMQGVELCPPPQKKSTVRAWCEAIADDRILQSVGRPSLLKPAEQPSGDSRNQQQALRSLQEVTTSLTGGGRGISAGGFCGREKSVFQLGAEFSLLFFTVGAEHSPPQFHEQLPSSNHEAYPGAFIVPVSFFVFFQCMHVECSYS